MELGEKEKKKKKEKKETTGVQMFLAE